MIAWLVVPQKSDVTVVTPVFDDSGKDILFYVGSRGHHADIGGLTPGSMPSDSKVIEEEGVLITNVRLVEGGRMREAEMRELLAGARYPARNIDQNLADLRAQIAANEKGREELLNMVAAFGLDVVRAYMRHVQDNAEESVRLARDDGQATVVALVAQRLDRLRRGEPSSDDDVTTSAHGDLRGDSGARDSGGLPQSRAISCAVRGAAAGAGRPLGKALGTADARSRRRAAVAFMRFA